MAPAPAFDPLDHLDASLRDFEPSSPLPNFEYPSNHSGFLESDPADTESLRDSVSAGGYSPPAWRRLGNGDRSSGFWRKSDNILGAPMLGGGASRESSPGYDSGGDDIDDDDAVLRRAIRTRLPTGSLSPEKERSPEPGYNDATVKLEERPMDDDAKSPLVMKEIQDNCRLNSLPCPPLPPGKSPLNSIHRGLLCPDSRSSSY